MKRIKESGMTLIEVMVAAAVAATISVVISQQLVTTNHTAKGITLKSNWESLINVIRYTANTSGSSGTNNINSCYNLLKYSFQQSGVPFPSGGPTPMPSQTPSPIALTVLGTSQNTFLKTGTSLNGIYAQQISLQEVPGYSTSQASASTYSDYVYLQIQAKRIMSPNDLKTANGSTSTNYDLFSGWQSVTGTLTPTAIDPIAFTIYKSTNGTILGCDGSTALSAPFQCTDLDPNAVYSNPLYPPGHIQHGTYEPHCQLTTLTLNATQIPGTAPSPGMPSTAKIVFGDWDASGGTTSNSPPPDTIVDSIQNRKMSINSQNLQMNPAGLMTPSGGPVSIGTPSTTPGFLTVGGRISQLAAPGSISSYLQTNALSWDNTSSLNPGILIYQNASPTDPRYNGLDLGYTTSGRYRTRLFARQDEDIAFSFHAANATPSLQANFTDLMVVQGGSGNVGIGTFSPSALLEVQGPTAINTPIPNALTVNSFGLIESNCTVKTCGSSSQGQSTLGSTVVYTCSCDSGILASGGAYCSGNNYNSGQALSMPSQSSSGTPGQWIALCNPTSPNQVGGGQPDFIFATCCNVSGSAGIGGPSVSLQNPNVPIANNGPGCSNPQSVNCGSAYQSSGCYAQNSVVTYIDSKNNQILLICNNSLGCQATGWGAWSGTCQ